MQLGNRAWLFKGIPIGWKIRTITQSALKRAYRKITLKIIFIGSCVGLKLAYESVWSVLKQCANLQLHGIILPISYTVTATTKMWPIFSRKQTPYNLLMEFCIQWGLCTEVLRPLQALCHCSVCLLLTLKGINMDVSISTNFQSFSSKCLAAAWTASKWETGCDQFNIGHDGNIWRWWSRKSGFVKSGLKNGLNEVAGFGGSGNGVAAWTGNRCGYWNPDSGE